MVTPKEAIDRIENTKSKDKVLYIGETDEVYLLSLDNDDEGCETVNKQTGELGFMWIWEYLDLAENGKVKDLDIEEIRKRAS